MEGGDQVHHVVGLPEQQLQHQGHQRYDQQQRQWQLTTIAFQHHRHQSLVVHQDQLAAEAIGQVALVQVRTLPGLHAHAVHLGQGSIHAGNGDPRLLVVDQPAILNETVLRGKGEDQEGHHRDEHIEPDRRDVAHMPARHELGREVARLEQEFGQASEHLAVEGEVVPQDVQQHLPHGHHALPLFLTTGGTVPGIHHEGGATIRAVACRHAAKMREAPISAAAGYL